MIDNYRRLAQGHAVLLILLEHAEDITWLNDEPYEFSLAEDFGHWEPWSDHFTFSGVEYPTDGVANALLMDLTEYCLGQWFLPEDK